MAKTIIATPNAPAAIGTYSQAVRVGDTVYLSGQIGLDPASMQLVDGIDAQIVRVFDNLKAVAEAAGGSLADVVKLNVFLTDLANFAKVNETMAQVLQRAVPGPCCGRRQGFAARRAGRGRCRDVQWATKQRMTQAGVQCSDSRFRGAAQEARQDRPP